MSEMFLPVTSLPNILVDHDVEKGCCYVTTFYLMGINFCRHKFAWILVVNSEIKLREM